MSYVNPRELGNMLIGAYIGELCDIHSKNETQLEVAQYPTISSNYELNFATTEVFDISNVKSLMPSSRSTLSEFVRSNIQMKELVKAKLSMDHLKNFLTQLKESDSLDIYGMLINLGSDKRINPLHPFIAQYIVNGSIQLPEEFEVIIYPMVKEKKIDRKGVETNLIAVVSLLNFINQKGQTAREVIKPKNSVFGDIRSLIECADPLEFTVEFQSQESSTMQNIITPVQFASDGVVTPYYGVIESTYSGGYYKSRQLSPMLTGNIQTTDTSYGNTCTGDLSNTRYSSLRVLNGVNMSSVYFDGMVSPSAFHWIKACQLVSIELLCDEAPNGEETQKEG